MRIVLDMFPLRDVFWDANVLGQFVQVMQDNDLQHVHYIGFWQN